MKTGVGPPPSSLPTRKETNTQTIGNVKSEVNCSELMRQDMPAVSSIPGQQIGLSLLFSIAEAAD